MNNNLYDNFARVIKSFSPESTEAANVADQYAMMTFQEESEPSSFMYCESNTWKLLSILADKNKSELQHYAFIRQWVSKVPNDKALLDKIHEKDLIEEEIEEELNFIIRKNRILKSHQDERPNKYRRKNNNNTTTEALCEEKYKLLRRGELIQVNDYKPLAYLYNEYVKFSQYALDPTSTHYINSKERLTWRDCVKHMAKDETIGRYEKALYNALAGNGDELYKTECQTWEDVIWAYLNQYVEDNIKLDKDIIKKALEKDDIMERDDPRILFHKIQSAILSNTTQELMKDLYQGYVLNNWNNGLYISNQYRQQVLRFISTWILFGREYLGWIEDNFTTSLLSAYTELNSQPTTFRPIVIASYAAKLSHHDQVRVFSDFLEHFDGDKEECIVISKLGKEYGLDIQNILKATNTNLLEKAFNTIKPTSSHTFDIYPEKEDTNYELFFRALHWLLIDDSLALSAVQSANTIIRFFYTHRKIYLVKQIFDIIPQSIYDRLMLEYHIGTEQKNAIDEFDLHRKVMLIFTQYKEWENLIHAKPKDSGSLDDLQAIYNWRDEAERQTMIMEDNIRSVLEGCWLKEDSNQRRKSSKVATRQLYIPEILIKYNNLLCSSVEVVEKNKGRSLIKYVTVEHRDLFDDIASSGRWEDVLYEFSKSLTEV